MAEAKNAEAKKAPEMVTAKVPKNSVRGAEARGWVKVRGASPDGLTWEGDTILMQMEASAYEKLDKVRRMPYERLRDAVRHGRSPVSVPTDEGVATKFSREDRPTQ